MKILMICESFPESEKAELTGGVETGDYYVAKKLAKKHQVVILTGARRNVPTQDKLFGIQVCRLGKPVTKKKRESVSSRLFFFFASIQYASKHKFDLVYASNFFTHAIAAHISWKSKKPVVIKTADVYIDTWIEKTNLVTGLIGECLERLTLKYPWSSVISWSRSTKKKLLQAGLKNKINVIGGAADKKLCQSIKVKKYQKPTMICVSRLVGYKRVDDVIKAFDLVLRQVPEAQLKIIGSGVEIERLQHLAEILGISNSIEFLGFVESHKKVIQYIKKSHLLIHASEVEGFGLVTLESLACGVPYVHSDLEVTREITDNGKAGLYFNVGDYHKASNQVVTLLTDKKRYNHLVTEAGVVTKNHSWSQVAKDTEKVFQEALKKN